ncbi:urea ABC transporter permease subunit UrtB [Veronia pacifica]
MIIRPWLSKKHVQDMFTIICLLCCAVFSLPSQATISGFADVESTLSKGKFKEKQRAISWLVSQGHPDARDLLAALLERKVVYDKKALQLWILEGKTARRLADSYIHAEPKSLKLRKVTINNAVRRTINEGIARLELSDTSPEKRLSAVKRLMTKIDASTAHILSEQKENETDNEIKETIELALAIHAVNNLNKHPADKLKADIVLLGASALPQAQQVLKQALPKTSNPELIHAINLSLDQLDQYERLMRGVETLYFGISLGSVLVLAGIGLAITFGVMGVINMAHGELVMLGAYSTYVMQQLLPGQAGLALLLSIPVAFIVSGSVGMLIERTVIRHLYGRPLETLLATFGLSLILQQAVRSVFSPLNRSVSTPEFMSGMLEISPMLSLTWNRLYIIAFCLIVFFSLLLVLKRTALGLQVRAVSQNRAMARAMGVRSERVDIMTFGIGAGVAGIAGVALSQLTNVGPNMGQAYIIDSFMVVVFGGVGNLWGTLVAGLSLGIFNKLLEPWAGAVLAKILVLVFIILFIQKRPKGLFPQRGRMAEG